MTDAQQRAAAKAFADYWRGKGYEKGESQAFWLSLLRDVYAVEHPEQFITFEEQVHLDHTSFIGGTIPSTHVLIEQTAQAILDARALYTDSSLADLYDELTMPPELRTAHQQNDRAVMQAYGFSVKDMTESSCVAELMKLYQQITEENAKNGRT